MRWSFVNEKDEIVNFIEYDGKAPIEVPDGVKLVQTEDWVDIGEHINTAKKVLPEMSAADIKAQRNKVLSKNLAVKALYLMEKKSNPNLSFSDYLDLLESEVVE